VQKRLAMGDNQAEIAKRLGKSRQWVTLTTALIEAPDWLMLAYREGRCRGMNELYDLRRLHGEHAQAVEAWVAQQGAITRDRLALLREELEPRSRPIANADSPVSPMMGSAAVREAEGPATSMASGAVQPGPTPPRGPNTDRRIHVEFDGQDYQLVVSVGPDQPGHFYVRPLNGGPRRLAPAAGLKLLGFVGD
jgi:ParB family transcriptional regulator, chromosome partitioning protein